MRAWHLTDEASFMRVMDELGVETRIMTEIFKGPIRKTHMEFRDPFGWVRAYEGDWIVDDEIIMALTNSEYKTFYGGE